MLQRIPLAEPAVLRWGGFMAVVGSQRGRREQGSSVCLSVRPAHTDVLRVGPRLLPLPGPESSRDNLFGLANLPFSRSQSQENQGSSGSSVEFQGFCGERGSRREQLRTGLMRGNQPP